MNSHAGHKAEPADAADPVKKATIRALMRVLDPLLDLMLDAGVTVQEFNKIARERVVRIANQRIVKTNGRTSISRVAIMTGLPRAEVKRLLDSVDAVGHGTSDYHPARRVLAAWHDDPAFLNPSGAPAVLPIFGRRRSFQQLVERYGGGIPVRAMLDDLAQSNAIEQMDFQRVRAKVRVPITTGMSERSIAAIGERGRDLLGTLAQNVRRQTQPRFEATAVIETHDSDIVGVLRREITEQGLSFINGATSLLNRAHKARRPKSGRSAATCRLGVTVFYFEDQISEDRPHEALAAPSRRKNLRRQSPKAKPAP